MKVLDIRKDEAGYIFTILIEKLVIEKCLPKTRMCLVCGVPFVYARNTASFCSNNCRQKYHRNKKLAF